MLRKREQGSSTAAMAIVIPSSWLSVERILWDCCRFIICFANRRGRPAADVSAPPSWSSSGGGAP